MREQVTAAWHALLPDTPYRELLRRATAALLIAEAMDKRGQFGAAARMRRTAHAEFTAAGNQMLGRA